MPLIEVSEDDVKRILEVVRDRDIKYVRLIVIDIYGSPRAMIIPEYRLEEALTIGIGFDGSSVPGYTNIETSDLVAHPDPSTFLIPLWETPGVALMFCYVSKPDGTPFEGDPRGLLKRTMDELEKRGIGFNLGPEVEFFYVEREGSGIRPAGSGGYFDLPPLDRSEEVKMETMICLEAAGFQLDKVHHEVAEGQHEINFRFADALKTADNIVLYKLAVKTIAEKYGVIATFMPKPFWGINGSGCHLHQSLIDLETGHNLFYDAESPIGLSDTALHYIGGLLKHASALSLVVAPTVNSYKRLVPHYEAPVYICWGLGNRSTLVRVPQYPKGVEAGTRVEYRHPDPSSNPYLAAVAVLKAGLDGVEHKIEPEEPIQENVYHFSREELERRGVGVLPGNLEEALEAFRADKVVYEALGGYVSENLMELKRREHEEYLSHVGGSWEKNLNRITEWEIERYLTRC